MVYIYPNLLNVQFLFVHVPAQSQNNFYCFGEKLGIYYDLIFKHLAMIISMIMMLKIVMMFLFYVLLA